MSVTVRQIDVRTGEALVWVFEPEHGRCLERHPDGSSVVEYSTLQEALENSDALAPMELTALAIDAAPHTDIVLSSLGARLAGRGSHELLKAKWSEILEDYDLYPFFWANQSSWLDSWVPVVIDGSECGVIGASGGPVALLFGWDEGDLCSTWVDFRDEWLIVEVFDPGRYDAFSTVKCGEIVEARFGVAEMAPDHNIRVEVLCELPLDHSALVALFRRVLSDVVGVSRLSDVIGLEGDLEGARFAGAVVRGSHEVTFEAYVSGPFRDVVRQELLDCDLTG